MNRGAPGGRGSDTRRHRHAPHISSLVCHAALLCGALAITTVNAAVPAVSADLEMGPARTQWFAAAYQLAAGPLQLGAGHLADRHGARRVLAVSLAVFVGGGLLAATAATPAVLIAARLGQGAGGSALSPVSLALLLALRRAADGEARVVAGWVSTAAAASCLGPLLGGLLTGLLGWRAVFGALTVLAVITAGCLLHPHVRAATSPHAPGEPLDITGIAMCTAAATAALIALTAPTAAAPPPVSLGAAAAAATLVGLLVYRVRRLPHSALDTGLLRQVGARRALLVLLVLFGANSAFIFVTYFALTHGHGLSPFRAALITLPAAAPALLTARLAAHRSGKPGGDGAGLMRTGLLCVAAGMLTGSAGRSGPTPVPLLLCACALVGSGLGLANGSAMTVLSATRTSGRPARAAATATTFAMLGGASGPAVAGASAVLSGNLLPACDATQGDALGTPAMVHRALPLIASVTVVLTLAFTRRVRR